MQMAFPKGKKGIKKLGIGGKGKLRVFFSPSFSFCSGGALWRVRRSISFWGSKVTVWIPPGNCEVRESLVSRSRLKEGHIRSLCRHG